MRGIVTEGYGILQPRVGVSLPSAGRSWFVRLFAGDAGIDPYTRAVSDVYQDVFQEGSFIGKGIYDVDAFQQAMTGRFPENAVLSHDLLEACHARSALVSDVEFYEEYPSRYNVDIDRRHRWIRGDWQISAMAPAARAGSGCPAHRESALRLSRWKIFDNLRRSLVPVAAAVAAGQLDARARTGGAGHSAWSWRSSLLPGVLVGAASRPVRKPAELPWAMHLRAVAGSCGRQLGQVFLTLVFLPYDAFISLDAIGRTLAAPAGDAQAAPRMANLQRCRTHGARRSRRVFATMWIAPVIALADGGFLVDATPGATGAGAAAAGGSGCCRRGSPGGSASPSRRRRRDLTADATGLPAPHRAQDLALF